MPGPVALDTHRVFYLNIRVPKDLAARLRGASVALPVDGDDVTVKIGDKVVVSSRTKDRGQAKLRFQHAAARLDAFFRAMRAAPKALSYKDVVALSGEAYRGFVENVEDKIRPNQFDGVDHAFEDEVRSFQYDGTSALSREDAECLAALALPEGPALLAWTRGGLEFGPLKMSEEEGLEDLFGGQADVIVARRGLKLDPGNRIELLKEIGRSIILGTARLKQVSRGDFSPDPHLARFPEFKGGEKVTVAELFTRWKTHNAGKVEPSTTRRYTPTLNSLAAYLPAKDVRKVDEDDIWP